MHLTSIQNKPAFFGYLILHCKDIGRNFMKATKNDINNIIFDI
jgi:hypothetical protein